MFKTIDDWLDCLPPELTVDLTKILDICKAFFSENMPLFKDCGFYAVGSSLSGGEFNDIDLVLAGLDFRQVFNYGEEFVGRKSKKKKEDDEESDHDSAHDIISEIDPHAEIINLAERIRRNTGWGYDECAPDIEANPFRAYPYVCDLLGETIVSSIEMRRDYVWIEEKPKKPSIHLMFHGENLTVTEWKKIQEGSGLLYLPIIEFYDPKNDVIENRPKFDISLPKFIDPQGRQQSGEYIKRNKKP